MVGKPKVNEKELVARAKEKDEDAFNLLFEKYQHRLLKHIRQWTDTEEDAVDVLMQSFTKIWLNLPRFRGESQFFTWAYKIARSEASNYRSSLMRRPLGNLIRFEDDSSIEDFIESQSDTVSPYDSKYAQTITSEEFESAVEELPQDLKEAFVLHLQGYKYEEIAEMLNTPDGTVRSRISRARDAMTVLVLGTTRREFQEDRKKRRASGSGS